MISEPRWFKRFNRQTVGPQPHKADETTANTRQGAAHVPCRDRFLPWRAELAISSKGNGFVRRRAVRAASPVRSSDWPAIRPCRDRGAQAGEPLRTKLSPVRSPDAPRVSVGCRYPDDQASVVLPCREYSGGMDATARVHRGTRLCGCVAAGGACAGFVDSGGRQKTLQDINNK